MAVAFMEYYSTAFETYTVTDSMNNFYSQSRSSMIGQSIQHIRSQERVGAVGRPPPWGGAKCHFSANCLSANIMNRSSMK